MCASSNEELYLRARNAAEADYLLEESLSVFIGRYHSYEGDKLQMALQQAREAILARRDGYALQAFDRALQAARKGCGMEQARALVESAGEG